jgi:hypothetical protein
MKRSTLLFAFAAGAALGAANIAAAQTMTKDARDAAYKSAEAQYKSEKDACGRMSGNAKDICGEEAKGRESIAKADADAAFENTPRKREAARLARADAAYAVAKEKCDDLAGNRKDVCVKEAKAAHVRAKGDANVDRVAADTRSTTAEKTADARRDAANDTRDAEYKVAIEKCDALASTVKDTCVRDAKARFGKS